MIRIKCELCGSSDIIKNDGKYTCQNCGANYSYEEAKKLLIDEEKTEVGGKKESYNQTLGEYNADNLNSKKWVGGNNKKIVLAIAGVVAVFIIAIAFMNLYIRPYNKYKKAIRYMDNKKYAEAYNLFNEITDFKDSSELQNAILGDYEAERIKQSQEGDIVEYGEYEQDGNEDNGKERIEWIVLESTPTKAVLVSKYGLEGVKYDEYEAKKNGYCYTEWKTSLFREWLNGFFYNEAFTESEKKRIVPVENTTDGMDSVTVTDRVFALENEDDLGDLNPEYLVCEPTPYALERGCSYYEGNPIVCPWWLRRSLTSFKTGTQDEIGHYVNYKGKIETAPPAGMKAAARPVIVIDTKN